MDIPAVLKTEFVKYLAKVAPNVSSEYLYNLFYTVYSFPNILLPFLGGVLVDRFGDRTMTIVFSLLILVGQAIFTMGIHSGSVAAMIGGRFIFGLGGETINITVMTILFRHFKGFELAFAQGVNVSLARISTILNYYLSPILFASNGLVQPSYVGVLMCAGSAFFAIILSCVDLKLTPREEAPLNGLGREEGGFATLCGRCRSLPRIFWYICAVTMTLYLTVMPFNQIASSYIIERWLPKESSKEVNIAIAARLMSVPFIVSAILFPFVGLIIDKVGARISFLLNAGLIVLGTHVALLYVYPLVPLFFLGLGYSLFGAIVWPTVAYVVSEEALGTAYGIQTSIQNLGLTLAPMIIATILTTTLNWNYVIGFFIVLAIISLLFTAVIQNLNTKLNRNSFPLLS